MPSISIFIRVNNIYKLNKIVTNPIVSALVMYGANNNVDTYAPKL